MTTLLTFVNRKFGKPTFESVPSTSPVPATGLRMMMLSAPSEPLNNKLWKLFSVIDPKSSNSVKRILCIAGLDRAAVRNDTPDDRSGRAIRSFRCRE